MRSVKILAVPTFRNVWAKEWCDLFGIVDQMARLVCTGICIGVGGLLFMDVLFHYNPLGLAI